MQVDWQQQKPQVIFLDAVGTLFGVKGSVGEAYSLVASQFGIEADPEVVNHAFFQSFRMAPPMAFPQTNSADIPQCEYNWWKEIARQTFQEVGLLSQFSDFSRFFASLYAYFATADPWFVYTDVHATLRYWRDQGIELAILSNFDTRIHAVLQALDLSQYFASVTISTEVGAAKPEVQVFQVALKKHQCSPDRAWHIGDSFREDYQGAKAAGLRAIWLDRSKAVAQL